MIKVNFYLNDDKQLVGFRISGHASYGEYGKDIVCAAVSALTINTVNSIKQFTRDSIEVQSDDEGGFLNVVLLKSPSDKTLLLFNSLEFGLTNIKKRYDKNIQISYREVYLC